MAAVTRRQQAAATRRHLTEIAREAFGREGYWAVSVGALLEKAGLARGAFYHHFSDKRALFAAVSTTIENEVLAWIAAGSHMPGGPWVELRAAGVLYLSACSDPAVRRILIVDGPALLGAEARSRRVAALRARLEAALVEDPDGARRLAPLLLGALDAAALQLGPSVRAEAWQDLHSSVTMLLEGLRLVHLQGVVPAVRGEIAGRDAWLAWQRRGASTPRS